MYEKHVFRNMRKALINLSNEELKGLDYGDLVTLCRQAGIREVELLEDSRCDGLSSASESRCR